MKLFRGGTPLLSVLCLSLFSLTSCDLRIRRVVPATASGPVSSPTPSALLKSWDFLAGTEADYSFDPSSLDFSAGVCRLRPVGSVPDISGNVFGSTIGRELTSTWAINYSGLVAYWKLDQSLPLSNGASVNSAAGVNGVVAGGPIQSIPGAVGSALWFDGVDDRLEFTGHGIALGTGPFTISLWANKNSATGRGDFFAWKGIGADLGIYVNGTTLQGFFNASIFASGCTFSAETWHHVVLTRNSSNLVTLYLDGAVCDTGTSIDDLNNYTSSPIWIGSNHDNSMVVTNPWNGGVDEVSISSTFLSAPQVLEMYQEQKPSPMNAANDRTIWDNTQQALRLSQATGFDASWTPQWGNFLYYWSFDGPRVAIADSERLESTLGSMSSTTVVGTSLSRVPGQIGQALKFDNTRIDALASMPTLAYTKSVWFQSVDPSPMNHLISGNGHALYVANGHLVAAHAGSNKFVRSPVSLVANRWYHAAVSYDSSVAGGTLTLYQDGVQVGTLASVAPDDASIFLGAFQGTFRLNGKMDEAAIWNVALTPTEIATIYSRQKDGNGGAQNASEIDPSWAPQASALTGHWTLDGTGTAYHGQAIPSTVPGSDGVYQIAGGSAGQNGTSYLAGKIGTALNFATNDYVQVSNGLNRAKYTKSIWFKPGTTGNLLSSANTGHFFYYPDLQTLSAGDFSNGQVTATFANSKFKLRTGSWYHAVVTYDSSVAGGTLAIYLNGRKLREGTGIGYTSGDSVLQIGAYTSTNFNDGALDEAATWNVALTAAEVEQLYERQAATRSGSLVSRILDGGTSAIWEGLSWFTRLPAGKELPDFAFETSTTYPDLVGSNGLTTDNNLMSNVIGNWHLNEVVFPGTAGDVRDQSNQHHDGTSTGVVSAAGKFGFAAELSGQAGNQIDVPIFSHTVSAFSVCAWVNPYEDPTWKTILATNRFQFVIEPTNNSSRVRFSGGGPTLVSNTLARYQEWQHLCFTADGSNLFLYVNGVQDATVAYSFATLPLTTLRIGSDGISGNGGTDEFTGKLDEIAVWSRKLHPSEVRQLFQRGGSRVLHQFRVCSTADCSDDPTGAAWRGVDGGHSSFFTELQNTDAPGNPLGLVRESFPNVLFKNFFTLTPKRYFQYRSWLESDDGTSACNYGSGSTWCSPEVRSVAVSPDNAAFTTTAIVGAQGFNFVSLVSLSETLSGSCPSGVGYNLCVGPDAGTATWYWWNAAANSGSGAWVVANGSSTKSNPATVITAHAPAFAAAAGSGTVFVKAFLKSNGSTTCTLDRIDLLKSQ